MEAPPSITLESSSPKTDFNVNEGIFKKVGLRIALPKAKVNSALVTRSGAQRLNGPLIETLSEQNLKAAIASRKETQLIG